MNEKDLWWIGGFFDGEGSFSFSSGSPSISLVNTDPYACFFFVDAMNQSGITAKINERSKPSKSSKKKRWDVFINQAEECFKFCELMKPYILGKNNQLDLMLQYKNVRKNTNEYHKKMRLFNQTKNILIVDKNKLEQKMGFSSDDITTVSDANKVISIQSFCNADYMAGLFDAEGTVNMHVRNKKNQQERYTPQITFTNTNKTIIENYYSTAKNNNIGCHISTRTFENRNRIRWDIIISGVNRTKKTCEILTNSCRVKKSQLELMLAYVNERIANPKSSNSTGYNVKMAIQSLRR